MPSYSNSKEFHVNLIKYGKIGGHILWVFIQEISTSSISGNCYIYFVLLVILYRFLYRFVKCRMIMELYWMHCDLTLTVYIRREFFIGIKACGYPNKNKI